MSNSVSEHLQSMFSKMENFVSAKTVVGEAVRFDDVIIVPLIEVSFASGSGLYDGKEAKNEGGGGAMGAKLSPVAVIVIVNGNVQLVDVKNKDSVNKLIDLIPGLMSNISISDLFKKKKNDDEDEADD